MGRPAFWRASTNKVNTLIEGSIVGYEIYESSCSSGNGSAGDYRLFFAWLQSARDLPNELTVDEKGLYIAK